MNATAIAPLKLRPLNSSAPVRFFHSGAAAVLLVLMLIGFQHFYFHGKAYPGRPLTPPIRNLIILHGTAMASWMILFLVQPLLIAAGNRRVHKVLGRIGGIVAACIVFFGFRLGIEATRVNPPDLVIWGLSPKQFMAVPIIGIFIFAEFVIAGIWTRRTPEPHRAMMLLATLAAMPAAISRIDAISNLYHGTFWEKAFGPFFATLIVGGVFLVVKSLLTRSLDRWYAGGYIGLSIAFAFIMQLARTSAWDEFATFLLR
jgi:hypothetical protein